MPRLDDVFSLRTFLIALAVFLAVFIAAIVFAGMTGKVIDTSVHTVVAIPTESTIAQTSGDLNQLDITTPPPKPVTAQPIAQAGKPQPRNVEDYTNGLVEKTPFGFAPVISKEGLTPFKAYSSTFAVDPKATALISFVMMDYGLSYKSSADAITNLPEGISFLLDANAKDAQKWTTGGRKYNHEIWLSLPLQPKDYPDTDTGPKTLLLNSKPEELSKRLMQTLSLATGYAGIIVSNANAFVAQKDLLGNIMTEISKRGLGVIESDPSDKILGSVVASTKAPYAQNNFVIDNVVSAKDIQSALITIEGRAAKDKKIIVFFKPYPAIVKAITDWSVDAQNRGVQLAPLSAVVQK